MDPIVDGQISTENKRETTDFYSKDLEDNVGDVKLW